MEPENMAEATVTPEFIKEGVEDSSEAAMLEPEIKLEIKAEPSDDSAATEDTSIIMEPEIKLEIKGEPSDDSATTEDTSIMEPEIKLEEGAVKLEVQDEQEDDPRRGCKSVK
jgi:hypothetical protein